MISQPNEQSDDLQSTLRQLAAVVDRHGDIQWRETGLGTTSQIRVDHIPPPLALFTHEAFGGRLELRKRSGLYTLRISGQGADDLVRHTLPHLVVSRDWFSFYIAAREQITQMRQRSGTRRVSPEEKAWRRDLVPELERLKRETRRARGAE